jgi:hypothetical protein
MFETGGEKGSGAIAEPTSCSIRGGKDGIHQE